MSRARDFAEAHAAAEAMRPEPLALRWARWRVRDDGRVDFTPNATAWVASAEDMIKLWEWIGANYLPPISEHAVRMCQYSSHLCPSCERNRGICYVTSDRKHVIHYVCGACAYRWTSEEEAMKEVVQ